MRRYIRRAKSASIVAVVFGVTFGVAASAAGQNVQVRPGAPAATLAAPSRVGIVGRDVTAADVRDRKLPGEFGTYVENVSQGGPAEKAGIRPGDVIVEFDGVRVRSYAELQRLVQETPAGRSVKVGVVRGGRRMDLAVVTEANPNARNFSFQVPMPEFREGPLLPPRSYRFYPELPSTRPPSAGRGLVFPGPIPLPPNTPRLGIRVQDLTPQLAEYFHTTEGVLVATVDDGSPASRAGVKAGDIITSIDGHAIVRADEVTGEIGRKRAGDEATLGLVRDGKPLTIKATLAGDRRGAVDRF